MRLSLGFTGFGPLEGTVEAVQVAEGVGFDGVWTAEHLGHHDAIVPSTLYLQATERIEIGMVGFSAASRHPGALRDGARVDVRGWRLRPHPDPGWGR